MNEKFVSYLFDSLPGAFSKAVLLLMCGGSQIDGYSGICTCFLEILGGELGACICSSFVEVNRFNKDWMVGRGYELVDSCND